MTARISLAWLAHPVSLLALALLLVNDHVLKAVRPGTVTGKLSDVAGLLVAPPLLAVLVSLCAPRLPSRGVAIGATVAVGVGFAAVKSSGTAAAAASALWTVVAGPSTVRADLTDLLALPALLGALAVWRAVRTRPAPARVARLLRVAVVLPLALLGVAATSADPTGTTVSASVDDSERLVIEADRGYLVSMDGGRTFQRQGFEQADHGDLTHSATMQCLPDRSLCYQAVRDRLRVEQSVDRGASWTVAWELPEHTRELLAREHADLLGSSGVMSYDLVVLPLESGHVVVAANGRDGLVVRDVTGAWTRVGDGAGPPAPLPSGLLPVRQWFAHIWPELGWVLLAALWCLTAATVVGLHRSGARRSALTVGLIAALGPCLLAMSPLVALDWTHLVWRGDDESLGRGWDQGLTALAGLLLAAGSLAVLVVPVVAVSIGGARRVLDRRHVGPAILAGVAVYLPYVVWGSGATTDYRAVSLAALAVFVLALIGVTVHAARARPALPPPTWQIPAYPLPAPRAPIDAVDAAAPVQPSSGSAQPTALGGDATAARPQPPGGEAAGTALPGLRSAAPSGGGPGDEPTAPAQES